MKQSSMEQYVIGVDFGTDSVRAVLADARNGRELSSSVFLYPRWMEQKYCDASENRFRQHPQDYVIGLTVTIKDCLKQAGPNVAANVGAISIATTGSTPVAVNDAGVPLAMLPGFEDNPNAMFILWKDHTAIQEAAEINRLGGNYLKYCGGIYSSEWFWAKLLHILREDKAVAKACFSFVEHCDWLPFLLTGGTMAMNIKRSRCAAGHKALWSAEWGGYPPNSFFKEVDFRLDGIVDTLFKRTYTAAEPAGFLSEEWAAKLGLPKGVIVGMGAFDAHMGAVGGQIQPYYLSKVMGTSTCDILVAPGNEIPLVKGICGQVDGSVIPGMCGLEAGQSAFGDAYAWLKNLLSWPLQQLETNQLFKSGLSEHILEELAKSAEALPLKADDELALDWLNGRRTPDADQTVTAAFTALSLGTDAPRLYKSLVEATCFGAKAIVERFASEGVPVKGIIGIGGVAKKSPYIMQVMADVLGMPIRIHRNEQTCAMGAAMFAATAAGNYPTVQDAMQAMGTGFAKTYQPDHSKKEFYEQRYARYQHLGKILSE